MRAALALSLPVERFVPSCIPSPGVALAPAVAGQPAAPRAQSDKVPETFLGTFRSNCATKQRLRARLRFLLNAARSSLRGNGKVHGFVLFLRQWGFTGVMGRKSLVLLAGCEAANATALAARSAMTAGMLP